MKTYRVLVIVSLFSVCGCAGPKPDGPATSNTAARSIATSNQETSSEFELRIEKAKAERLGFTFARMADYFSSLQMSKHEYSTKWVGETFVIGMRETPGQLKRIMGFSLTTDDGRSVKVKDLCTMRGMDK